MSLDAESAGLASSGGKAASFAVLVSGVADPVDARVVADSHVGRVNSDNLVVFKGGVLINPVRVKHTQIHGMTAGTFLRNRLQVAVKFQVVNTSVHGLSVNNSVGHRSLAATTTHSDAVHAVALLGLVAKLVSLISTGRARELHHLVSLAVLPCSIMTQTHQRNEKRKKQQS